MEKERYENLDGLRAISCLCIVGYHIKKYSEYDLTGAAAVIIDSWTHFVPLFLIISGFGIFCGYYERVKNGTLDINTFYKKRYVKILPFFLFVMLIDLAVERSLSHLIETVMQATLTYGLLPNIKMEVCGVGWTIGIIFLFYMLFPFFVFLCNSRRRTVISFVVSIAVSLLCSGYFFSEKFVVNFTPRHSFLYCAPYFLAGGGYISISRRNQSNRFQMSMVLL